MMCKVAIWSCLLDLFVLNPYFSLEVVSISVLIISRITLVKFCWILREAAVCLCSFGSHWNLHFVEASRCMLSSILRYSVHVHLNSFHMLPEKCQWECLLWSLGLLSNFLEEFCLVLMLSHSSSSWPLLFPQIFWWGPGWQSKLSHILQDWWICNWCTIEKAATCRILLSLV